MYLDTPSKVLQVILASAKTTNDCEITADYIDTQDGATFAPGNSLIASNGTSAVSVVAAPAASTQRKISAFTFYNADTVNTTVTVRIYDGTNTWRIRVATLVPGQSLIYTPELGWSLFQSTPGQIIGTDTNDNAAAGNVGEYTEDVVLVGSAVSLTNNTAAQVASISLTAGDWDVNGVCHFTGGGTTSVAYLAGGISNSSLNLGTSGTVNKADLSQFNSPSFGADDTSIMMGPARFLNSTNTIVYLNAQAGFSAGSCSVYGQIRARRVR